MTSGRISNCYIYDNNCAPNVADSALHLAAYNGRTDKFRTLLAANPESIHKRTSDNHNATPFTVALSRGHSPIAAICLQQMEPDLATLRAHFAGIGGAIFASHFWLRNQVMIVTDPPDVEFARSESVGLLADPEEMQMSANGGTVRRGLIVLLKPEAREPEVLWLTARHCGDDRRLARIVARCCQHDNWLDILQPDLWGHNCFYIAARRNLPDFWQLMYAAFGGQHWLTRRELASSFRLLAEHQPKERRVQHFEGLCRSWGGFEAADLFAADWDEAGQTYVVLQDAVREYNGDPFLLDYLVELAAQRLMTAKNCTLSEAISQVIQLRLPVTGDRVLFDWNQCLLDWAFHHQDATLIWQCLRYEPDLFAKLSTIAIDLIWSLLHRLPLRQFETTLRTLIEKQIFATGRTDILVQLFRELCRAEFGQTARLVWSRMSAEQREDPDWYVEYLLDALRVDDFDTVQCLLEVLPSQERLLVTSDALFSDWDRPERIPEAVWTQLLPGSPHEWNAEHVGQYLCTTLEKRQIAAYERVWQLVRPTFVLKDARDYSKASILFHSIYNALAQRYERYPGIVETDCREIIDSDDDDESAATKIAANDQRPIADAWEMKPGVLIVDDALEAFYLRIFEQLVADGADVAEIHPYSGQSLLHVAVARNNLAVARRLLQLGLDPSAVDTAGNVPMSYVRSVEMIALLPLADVLHVSTETKRTPLAEYLLASDYRLSDIEVVRTLVAAGADVNRRDETTGMTPLMMLPSPEVATFLLAAGADVNAKDASGRTVLHRYRFKEHEQLVRLLLKQPGVKVFPEDIKADSLLLGLMRFIPLHELQLIAPQISDDQAELERLFARESNGLSCLSSWQRDKDANDLRCLQRLLEQPDLDLRAEAAKWTTDSQRLKLERGAHISQRQMKSPLDWTMCKQPFDVCNEIEFFALAGFNVDYNVDDRFQKTALQGYADHEEDKCKLTRILAHLVAAGANYRLMQMDNRPALTGLALECLYEWDEERGLTVPPLVEQLDEDEVGNAEDVN